ncbi:hypothetical protein ES707_02115 [subsurface metagenome]
MRLAVDDQFGDGSCGNTRVRNDHVGKRADHDDRIEACDRIVSQLLVEAYIDDERPGRSQHQRMTVGGRVGHEFRCDIASRAGAILDDNGLTDAGP